MYDNAALHGVFKKNPPKTLYSECCFSPEDYSREFDRSIRFNYR